MPGAQQADVVFVLKLIVHSRAGDESVVFFYTHTHTHKHER